MNNSINQDTLIHHIKEAIITLIPSAGGIATTLLSVDVAIKAIVGILTCVWMGYRIAIARKEFKSK